MKLTHIVLFLCFSLVGCSGENSLSDAVSMSPGTLGSVADHELNCTEYELAAELDALIENIQLSPSLEDTNIVNWWKRNQYDFLNYKCIKIRDRLYMITIHSESSLNTNLGIRSFYDRTKKIWVFATEFNSNDKYKAKRAMNYLLNHLPCYQ